MKQGCGERGILKASRIDVFMLLSIRDHRQYLRVIFCGARVQKVFIATRDFVAVGIVMNTHPKSDLRNHCVPLRPERLRKCKVERRGSDLAQSVRSGLLSEPNRLVYGCSVSVMPGVLRFSLCLGSFPLPSHLVAVIGRAARRTRTAQALRKKFRQWEAFVGDAPDM